MGQMRPGPALQMKKKVPRHRNPAGATESQGGHMTLDLLLRKATGGEGGGGSHVNAVAGRNSGVNGTGGNRRSAKSVSQMILDSIETATGGCAKRPKESRGSDVVERLALIGERQSELRTATREQNDF